MPEISLNLAGEEIEFAPLATAESALFLAQTPTLTPQPIMLHPLDTNLRLSFVEVAGRLTLELTTEKIYGCYNYEVDAGLTSIEENRIEIQVNGIYQELLCQETLGPAIQQVQLGQLAGKYELRFRYQDISDIYSLAVTADAIQLQPVAAHFTWPEYATWQRLPPGAVWFGLSNCPPEMDSAAYRAATKDFYRRVQKMDARPLELPEGVYSQRDFIPPWPAWQLKKGDHVYIPIDEHWSRGFREPDIRYFVYNGDWETLVSLLQSITQPACHQAYNWQGKTFPEQNP